MSTAWKPFLNPADPGLYGSSNDVDWLMAEYVNESDEPRRMHEANPWIPEARPTAERMIAARHDETLALLGALRSWRVCTVSQLQAGLCPVALPDFDYGANSLYGALLRLGCVNVGFSGRERFERVRVPETWLSMGSVVRSTRRVLKLIGATPAERALLTDTTVKGVGRRHARHNTYAAHVGLTCMRDGRVDFACGDGWSAFKTIDPKAVEDAGLRSGCAADVAVMGRNGVMAGIEVQTGMSYVFDKVRRWKDMLLHSPMDRRGLVCVWLVIGKNGMPLTDSARDALLTMGADLDGLTSGMPPVGTRMGLAYWNDWYDAKGKPTDGFGTYVDMFGHRRGIFDPQWESFTPDRRPLDEVAEWGWRTMRGQIRDYWGWDTPGWAYPDAYRGGVNGFVTGAASKRRKAEGDGR